jgi:hypothetical protein
MNWLVHRSLLNADQIRAVQFPANKHCLISGAPFTGKSQVVIHRAQHFANTYRIEPGRMRIFTASRIAQIRLQNAATILGLSPEIVNAYDDWCSPFLSSLLGCLSTPPPLIPSAGVALQRTLFRTAHQWELIELPSYDAVFVDDSDSFSTKDLDLIKKLARHLTLFSSTPSDAGRRKGEWRPSELALGRQSSDVTLETCYQKNRALSDWIARIRGRPLPPHFGAQRHSQSESLGIFLAQNVEQEMDRLATVLRDRIFRNEQIAIFAPDARTASELGSYMLVRSLHTVQISQKELSQSELDGPAPKIVTADFEPAVTFDTVLHPMLDRYELLGYLPAELISLLAASCERANLWAYFSSSKPVDIPFAHPPASAAAAPRPTPPPPKAPPKLSAVDDLL